MIYLALDDLITGTEHQLDGEARVVHVARYASGLCR